MCNVLYRAPASAASQASGETVLHRPQGARQRRDPRGGERAAGGAAGGSPRNAAGGHGRGRLGALLFNPQRYARVFVRLIEPWRAWWLRDLPTHKHTHPSTAEVPPGLDMPRLPRNRTPVRVACCTRIGGPNNLVDIEMPILRRPAAAGPPPAPVLGPRTTRVLHRGPVRVCVRACATYPYIPEPTPDDLRPPPHLSARSTPYTGTGKALGGLRRGTLRRRLVPRRARTPLRPARRLGPAAGPAATAAAAAAAQPAARAAAARPPRHAGRRALRGRTYTPLSPRASRRCMHYNTTYTDTCLA